MADESKTRPTSVDVFAEFERSFTEALRPILGQVARQPRQRPARQRNPLPIGTGTGHADDPLALITRDPAGTPPP